MATKVEEKKNPELECCPELIKKPTCDILNFRYRLPFRAVISKEKRRQVVPVEVVLNYTLERCSGPLLLGDLIYSITLLPGEEVRLFTSDRHTRWSYDNESNLAYRHQTTSEESFFTAAIAQSMSDITINEDVKARSSSEDSWASGGGGASLNLFGLVKIGGGAEGGYYDSESTYDLSRSLSSHAEYSSRSAAAGVRAKSSTAIGEVQTRTHSESESEAHYESSSRLFKNRNKCSAVTFLFYKINKLQTVRFKLTAIERRVIDFAAPTGVYPYLRSDIDGGVSVIKQEISATNKNRLEIERMARNSVQERLKYFDSGTLKSDAETQNTFARFALHNVTSGYETFSKEIRRAAIAEVDKDLASKGILNPKDGTLSEKFVTSLEWERQEILPTPGVIVKGCLDKCNVCEPALQKEIEYDLENKRLQNELLKKQIDLLEKSQEYRCCPGEVSSNEEDEE